MIGVIALLALAAATVFGAPLLLAVRPWTVRHPSLALGLWVTAFAVGVAALIGSLVLTLVLAVGSGTSSADSGLDVAIGLGAWFALAAVGAVMSLVLVRAEPIVEARASASSGLELLVATATYRSELLRGVRIAHVRSDVPFACASPADGGLVVVTSGLADAVGPAGLRVVVEHERAHLAGRHDLVLALGTLHRACAPAVLGAHAMDRAVHLLVELIADDAAVRVCGPAAVRDALIALDAVTPNEWTRMRAARLDVQPRPRRRPRAASAAVGASRSR